MIRFLTEPTLERWFRGRMRLVTPLVAHVNGRHVEVPKGFITDGASVPAIFWPVISHPLSPSSLRAAILHDYLCRERLLPSKAVHWAFYEALLADGCARVRAWLMWLAVLVFGPRFQARNP